MYDTKLLAQAPEALRTALEKREGGTMDFLAVMTSMSDALIELSLLSTVTQRLLELGRKHNAVAKAEDSVVEMLLEAEGTTNKLYSAISKLDQALTATIRCVELGIIIRPPMTSPGMFCKLYALVWGGTSTADKQKDSSSATAAAAVITLEAVASELKRLQVVVRERAQTVVDAMQQIGSLSREDLLKCFPELFQLDQIVALNNFLAQIEPKVRRAAAGFRDR